jgi:hypothetical protein
MANKTHNGSNYDKGTLSMKFQLDSLSTDTDATIQAELAADPECVKCAPGSTAITDDLEVLCRKRNNGTWRIIR